MTLKKLTFYYSFIHAYKKSNFRIDQNNFCVERNDCGRKSHNNLKHYIHMYEIIKISNKKWNAQRSLSI